MEQAKQPITGRFLNLGVRRLVLYLCRFLLSNGLSEIIATDNRILTDGAGQTAEIPPAPLYERGLKLEAWSL